MIPRKSPRSPGPFLVVPQYTIWTHGHNSSNTSCDPCPPRQLGEGRLHYRRVCIYVAHGKQRRSTSTTSWYLSCGNIFFMVAVWRSEPGLPLCSAYSRRNSSRCSPPLNLTSPRDRDFAQKTSQNPAGALSEEDNLLHATKPRKVDYTHLVNFLWHLRWDSRVCTILYPNIVFTTCNKLYTTIRTSLFPFQSLNQNHM